MIDERLNKQPEEKVLFCISPPAAKLCGYLPIRLSDDEKTLHVIVKEGFSNEDLPNAEEMFRKKIQIDGSAKSFDWEESHKLFYEGYL